MSPAPTPLKRVKSWPSSSYSTGAYSAYRNKSKGTRIQVYVIIFRCCFVYLSVSLSIYLSIALCSMMFLLIPLRLRPLLRPPLLHLDENHPQLLNCPRKMRKPVVIHKIFKTSTSPGHVRALAAFGPEKAQATPAPRHSEGNRSNSIHDHPQWWTSCFFVLFHVLLAQRLEATSVLLKCGPCFGVGCTWPPSNSDGWSGSILLGPLQIQTRTLSKQLPMLSIGTWSTKLWQKKPSWICTNYLCYRNWKGFLSLATLLLKRPKRLSKPSSLPTRALPWLRPPRLPSSKSYVRRTNKTCGPTGGLFFDPYWSMFCQARGQLESRILMGRGNSKPVKRCHWCMLRLR